MAEEDISKNRCEDRRNLAEKLDKEVEDFIGTLEKKPYQDGFTAENFDKEIQEHPAFRTDPVKEGDSLPPLVEALQQLKYDPEENTPAELARNYKDDGNYNFKLKKYRWAVNSYTEGIKQDCTDAEVNAQLYTNRAAAHYHLGNYRSANDDCECAFRHKPDHLKAIVRAVQCCQNLQRYNDVVLWCNRGLQVSPKDKFLSEEKQKAEKHMKVVERNKRKNLILEKKSRERTEDLIAKIKSKGIRLVSELSANDLSALEPCHPAADGTRVFLDEDGFLVWPVLFVYPEHGQTDFVRCFKENDSFVAYLQLLFNPTADPPPWDTEIKYRQDNLKISFEDKKDNVLCMISPNSSLSGILQNKRYVVFSGSPSFFITVKDSPFHEHFLTKFSKALVSVIEEERKEAPLDSCN